MAKGGAPDGQAALRAVSLGTEYTHALAALSAAPPFEPLAASGEFCIEVAGTNDACESIQMVMALTRAKRPSPGWEGDRRSSCRGAPTIARRSWVFYRSGVEAMLKPL